MSLAQYSLTIFVVLNVVRAFAYCPQIVRIYRDPGNASAVSLLTWIVFTAANTTTVIYALTAIRDFIVATVFGVNAIGCATIVIFTTYKRCHHHLRVRKDIGAGLLPEPDCHSGRREFVANASPSEKARARELGSLARWRAARSARKKYIHGIAKKGLATVE